MHGMKSFGHRNLQLQVYLAFCILRKMGRPQNAITRIMAPPNVP